MADFMSATELQSKLYKHFSDGGLLNNLRTQLRSQLANEMFKVASPVKESGSENDPQNLLPLQISNWLVCDHLKRYKFEYSLSTFVSEASISHPDKLLSIKDVLNVIGIDERSPEYVLLMNSYKESKESFLYLFLSSVSSYSKTDTVKRKDRKEGNSENRMEDKVDMSIFDDKKRTLLTEMHPSKVFDPYNVLSYSNKPSNFEDSALLYRQLQLEKEKHEVEILDIRQKLLREIDDIKDREYRQKLELEKERSRFAHEQSLLNMEKAKLKIKELELQTKFEAFDKEADDRVKSKIQRFPHGQQQKEFSGWEYEVKEQQKWLESEINKIKMQANESKELKERIKEMEESYRRLQAKHAKITRKNDDLQNEINSMSDYEMVKEDLSLKTRRLADAERKIIELKSELDAEKKVSFDTIRKLQQQLVQTLPKLSAHPDTYYGHHPSRYPNSDGDEKESQKFCKIVIERFQEQKDDIQELHRLVQNMHYFLNHEKDQKSVETFISAKPTEKPDDRRKTIEITNAKLNTQSSIIENKTPINMRNFSGNAEYALKYRNAAFDFILDARKRINSLEKESKTLSEKYSSLLNSTPRVIPNFHVDDYVYDRNNITPENVITNPYKPVKTIVTINPNCLKLPPPVLPSSSESFVKEINRAQMHLRVTDDFQNIHTMYEALNSSTLDTDFVSKLDGALRSNSSKLGHDHLEITSKHHDPTVNKPLPQKENITTKSNLTLNPTVQPDVSQLGIPLQTCSETNDHMKEQTDTNGSSKSVTKVSPPFERKTSSNFKAPNLHGELSVLASISQNFSSQLSNDLVSSNNDSELLEDQWEIISAQDVDPTLGMSGNEQIEKTTDVEKKCDSVEMLMSVNSDNKSSINLKEYEKVDNSSKISSQVEKGDKKPQDSKIVGKTQPEKISKWDDEKISSASENKGNVTDDAKNSSNETDSTQQTQKSNKRTSFSSSFQRRHSFLFAATTSEDTPLNLDSLLNVNQKTAIPSSGVQPMKPLDSKQLSQKETTVEKSKENETNIPVGDTKTVSESSEVDKSVTTEKPDAETSASNNRTEISNVFSSGMKNNIEVSKLGSDTDKSQRSLSTDVQSDHESSISELSELHVSAGTEEEEPIDDDDW